jgi:hypothetical protein
MTAPPPRPTSGETSLAAETAGLPGGRLASAASTVRMLAGPALILATVTFAMRDFIVGGRIAPADHLSFWLPQYCFLGRSLGAGHIPAWNPYLMAGVPFAADPQSGWMYLPPMMLFTVLPCDVAMAWMVALQPLLAALGIYWFCRSEGVSRAAATVGGLSLGMAMAGSNLVLSMPFSGILAWTALTLAALSRYVQASAWPARLGWGFVAAIAGGQLAAAHLSMGALLGAGVLLSYLVGKMWTLVRSGAWTGRDVVRTTALIGVMVPCVNLAFLLPRLAYLPDTSLSLGYQGLRELGAQLVGKPAPQFRIGPGTEPAWPLDLAASPGPYLGAVTLALAFAACWRRERRPLAVAFSLYGAVTYVLGLSAVAAAVPEALRPLRLTDLYLHNPQWLSFHMPAVVALVGALGVDAWIREASFRRRILMVVPGVAVWAVLPLLLGAAPNAFLLLAVGAIGAGATLLLASRTRAFLGVLPLLLAIELVANVSRPKAEVPFPAPGLLTAKIRPHRKVSEYLTTGPIAGALQTFEDRYTRLGGFRVEERDPPTGNGIVPNHALLFSNQNAAGYNPVQLLRYWSFVRASQHRTLEYSRAAFGRATPPVALDLLQMGSIIAPEPIQEASSVPISAQGRWRLFRLAAAPPRVSLVGSWEVVQDPQTALELVLEPGFDPRSTAVLEADSGIREMSGTQSGEVIYEQVSDQEARLTVKAASPGIVVIRTSFDRHWHAHLNGRETPVLHADYLLQGVAVPAGRHVVVLSYDDPWIGYGLAGSALSVMGLGAAGVLVRWRRGKREASSVRNGSDHGREQ